MILVVYNLRCRRTGACFTSGLSTSVMVNNMLTLILIDSVLAQIIE